MKLRLARRDDLEALRSLVDAAISELQRPFLTEDQINSSRAIMGIDTQLIDDGTYFVLRRRPVSRPKRRAAGSSEGPGTRISSTIVAACPSRSCG